MKFLSLDDLNPQELQRIVILFTSHPAHCNYTLQTLLLKFPAAEFTGVMKPEWQPAAFAGTATHWREPFLTGTEVIRLEKELSCQSWDAVVLLYNHEKRQGYQHPIKLASSLPARYYIESYYLLWQYPLSFKERRFMVFDKAEFSQARQEKK